MSSETPTSEGCWYLGDEVVVVGWDCSNPGLSYKRVPDGCSFDEYDGDPVAHAKGWRGKVPTADEWEAAQREMIELRARTAEMEQVLAECGERARRAGATALLMWPTEPGWYYYRGNPTRVFEAEQDGGLCILSDTWEDMKLLTPIEETDRSDWCGRVPSVASWRAVVVAAPLPKWPTWALLDRTQREVAVDLLADALGPNVWSETGAGRALRTESRPPPDADLERVSERPALLTAIVQEWLKGLEEHEERIESAK